MGIGCLFRVKKDGGFRMVIDYRKLNQVTQIDAYPLPRIPNILQTLKHTRYLTTSDLTSGYWQLALDQDSIETSAIITPFGSYLYVRMPFGLSGAPNCFQRCIRKILEPILGAQVQVYSNDVIVATETFDEHLCVLD